MLSLFDRNSNEIVLDFKNNKGIRYRVNHPLDKEEIVPKECMNYPNFYHFPENEQVLVSKTGKIMNAKTGKILKIFPNEQNRLRFVIGTKNYKLHRVIAITFIGRPFRHINKEHRFLEVNHINGDPTDVNIENLEWVTMLENKRHSAINNFGKQNIKVLAKHYKNQNTLTFPSISECSRAFNIHPMTLSDHLEKGDITRRHFDGYFFKFDDHKPWVIANEEEFIELGSGRSIPILVINLITGNKFEYGSITRAIKETGVDSFSLRTSLRRFNDIQLGNYHFLKK